jgi:hypothetical protein
MAYPLGFTWLSSEATDLAGTITGTKSTSIEARWKARKEGYRKAAE